MASSAAPSGAPPSSSSASGLPAEVRLQILSNTTLVQRDKSDGSKTGLHVNEGTISYPQHHSINMHGADCLCPEPPTKFFSLGPTLREEATETMLSQNRLVFSGSPRKSLDFLRGQGGLVRCIREVDFMFLPDEIRNWTEGEAKGSWDGPWRELVEYIAANLTLSNLTLSLDAGPGFIVYQEQYQTEETMDYVLEAYKMIVAPLKGLGGKGLKGFYAFFAAFHAYETEAEKEVMGEGYVAKDKVPSTKRNPLYPHGCPRPEMEWEDGMELC